MTSHTLALLIIASLLWKASASGDPIAVSDLAPISAALWKKQKSRRAIIALFSHFESTGAAFPRSRSCTKSWRKLPISKEIRARFPYAESTTSGCQTHLFSTIMGERVWRAMNEIREGLNNSAQSIIERTNIGWKRVYPSTTHNPFSEENCDVRFIGAVRSQGRWMLWIRISSIPIQSGPAPNGSSMSEFVLPFGASQQTPIQRIDGSLMKNATTTMLQGRIVSACCIERKHRHLIVKHKKWQVYAAQSIRASNVATLVLPLLLCLLPTTLFIDGGTKVGVAYSLTTKVLNVLPLAFKGAELIHLAKNPPVSLRSSGFGLNRERGFGIATTLAIRCEVDSKLVPIGISFIVVSVIAMMFGLFLDSRTRRRRVRREREIRKRPILIRSCIDCYCAGIFESNSSDDESSARQQLSKICKNK